MSGSLPILGLTHESVGRCQADLLAALRAGKDLVFVDGKTYSNSAQLMLAAIRNQPATQLLALPAPTGSRPAGAETPPS